jgi:hypothetical protein
MAVCCYFFGKKRKKVYNDLKKNIQVTQYDDMEDALIHYGHPFSVALSYGYKPMFYHLFNKKVVTKVEKNCFIVSGCFLIVSTLYYLQQLNCLPFFSNHNIFNILNNTSILSWALIHPVYILSIIFVLTLLYLFILEKKHPINQQRTLKWDINELNKLPHPSHYPNHTNDTYLMIAFIIYFLIYTLIFSTSFINNVRSTLDQSIRVMTYFFQPFILIILFEYIIDMTKKVYTKNYLKYTIAINIFIFISISIFLFNSSFLKDYIFTTENFFNSINILIIIAVTFVYVISIYKLTRGILAYRSMFKK